jgi:hypothetical protein
MMTSRSRRFGGLAFTRATPLPLDIAPPRHVVSGRWRGWWVVTGCSTAVGLSLSQSGDSITGMLTLGPNVNNRVRGVVDERGFVHFEGADAAPGGCVTFRTVGLGLVLLEGDQVIEGPVRRQSRGPCPGGRSVETVGTLTLRKVR